MERKTLIRALFCDEEKLLGNVYRLTFGCLFGGNLSVYRPPPFTIFLGEICPFFILCKDIVVMVLVVALGF